jgi:ABC-type antimicrobial peptide transport system permease subunit
MLEGDKSALEDPYSVILSSSLAKKIFQYEDPLGKTLRVNDRNDVIVRGVFQDQPKNSSLHGVELILPTELNLINNPWKLEQGFTNNFLGLYVQIAPQYTFEEVSEVIKEVIYEKLQADGYGEYHPTIFIHPMEKWHLYGEWDNGVNTGRIRFVKLFGTIGIFILLLACINFMNLSTARSEKRAKEVGIRKSIGSRKKQLIAQFLIESCLMVSLSFLLAILLASLGIGWFNTLADKQVELPFTSPVFWGISLLFILVTGAIAGSYPSFYLSSFNPTKILKGTFKSGRNASLPRKVLVVVQFTVSVILIIGTIVVYQQIQFAKNRPVGYDREGLVMVEMMTDEHRDKFEVIKTELLETGDIEYVAKSLGPVTDVWSSNGGFSWKGNPPLNDDDFATISVSPDYGETVKWEFVDGRDFSSEFASDSSGIILNETAVETFGMDDPVGQIVRWAPSWGEAADYRVLGVIKDVVMRSPYFPNMPSAYFMNDRVTHINLRLRTGANPADALASAEKVFKEYIPDVPFTYEFADANYARKFDVEERAGRLSSVFAFLAVIISCLGLFGLAAFVAEQRTKEIGIRKVVGASIFTLWKLQASGFLWLVVISAILAIPIAYYGMQEWLSLYDYRINMEWWIFAAALGGAILLTIITVSFQAIRAARINPVLSLRSE